MDVPIDYSVFADLYDALVRFDGDLPFFTDEARAARGPVLELMAGTGRVSLPLLEAGVDLCCVDYSLPMLRVLRAKIAGRGLPGRLVLADVRRLPLAGDFALAILPFNSFAEVVTESARRAALRSIRSALLPGGRFICTLHNPAVRRRSIDGRLRELARVPHPAGRGELVLKARFDLDPKGALVTGVEEFEEYDGEGNLLNRRSTPASFALIEPDAFESEATAAGFSVLARYGDYDGSELSTDTSPYVIWTLGIPPAGEARRR